MPEKGFVLTITFSCGQRNNHTKRRLLQQPKTLLKSYILNPTHSTSDHIRPTWKISCMRRAPSGLRRLSVFLLLSDCGLPRYGSSSPYGMFPKLTRILSLPFSLQAFSHPELLLPRPLSTCKFLCLCSQNSVLLVHSR